MDGAPPPAMTLSPDIMLAPRKAHDLRVEVIHATGIDGARHARGLVVVIDVLRAFTGSAPAIALAKRIPGALICAEEDGLPIPGIPISNSPTQIKQTDMNNRILVQRSSAGTQVAAAVPQELRML